MPVARTAEALEMDLLMWLASAEDMLMASVCWAQEVEVWEDVELVGVVGCFECWRSLGSFSL